jgi:hypothetical protein
MQSAIEAIHPQLHSILPDESLAATVALRQGRNTWVDRVYLAHLLYLADR